MLLYGKGQGCDPTYVGDPPSTTTPVSSHTSRATTSSYVSPNSTNPERTVWRPGGCRAEFASSIFSPQRDDTAAMMLGSWRG